MANVKDLAASILGRVKPGKEQDGNGGMPTLVDLMTEFGEALKSGDYRGAASAFEAARSYEGPEGDEPEEPEAPAESLTDPE